MRGCGATPDSEHSKITFNEYLEDWESLEGRVRHVNSRLSGKLLLLLSFIIIDYRHT